MSPRSLVLALCAAVALTGCGGGTSQSSPTSAPTAATPAALTFEKALVLGGAAVLTAADLPGYTMKATTRDAGDEAIEVKMLTCLGVTGASYLTRNFGRSFNKNGLEIHSAADVATSAADAKREMAAVTSKKAPACFKSQLTTALASSGITVTSFSFQRARVTIPDSDLAFAFTMRLTATVQGRKIELRGVTAGSVVGQVEVGLTGFGPVATTLTLKQATALLAKVTARTKDELEALALDNA